MRSTALKTAMGRGAGAICALWVASAACASGPDIIGADIPTDINTPVLPTTTLGAGDVIEVRVYREPDLAGVYRVAEDGMIEFPLIGRLDLRSKTADQVAGEIQGRLAEGYLKDPQVAVFVKEYQSLKVHVLGQVHRSGTFRFEPGMTVVQAVTNAGGFGKLAAPNSVTVTRVIDGKEHRFKLPVGDISKGDAPNFELRPGDIIFVPEAIF